MAPPGQGRMMTPRTRPKQTFFVELIQPSRYDADGYVIQWWRSFLTPGSLGCLYGLAVDLAGRRVLGDDVEIVVNAYDEYITVIPIRKMIRRKMRIDHRGLNIRMPHQLLDGG